MSVQKDIVAYNVYEIDLWKLQQKIAALQIEEAIVYGIGSNGYATYTLLKAMNIGIKYFVDIRASKESILFNKIQVISPEQMLKQYDNEYIIVTPAIHDEIIRWMVYNRIPKDNIIKEFYQTESIEIDYGGHYGSTPSADVKWCLNKPQKIKGTFFTIAYNTPENLFRRSIESVLNQTESDFSYLIIVNGATDNTYRIASEYAKRDVRIKLYELSENLRWTEPKLLNILKDNIEGDYCCQLDSDDYYDKAFLEKTIKIGIENKADVICTRTCLFSADNKYNPMRDGFLYDWHDRFFFNITHPMCHFIGHKEIMLAYSRSKICSTFWGKLYSNALMNKYLGYILDLPKEDRELYYRLDISMTYRILYMSERVFFSDKPLHFSQYSGKNSTYTLAPIEWLLALWYAYKGLRNDNYLFLPKRFAAKYSREFLKIHLPWMVNRRGMLNNPDAWAHREKVIMNLKEMADDSIFKNVLLHNRNTLKLESQEFYETMKNIVDRY